MSRPAGSSLTASIVANSWSTSIPLRIVTVSVMVLAPPGSNDTKWTDLNP